MTSIVSSLHSQSEPITDVIRFIMSDTPRNILKMACLNKKYQKITEEVLTQYIDAYIASRGQHSLVGRIKHHLSSCCSPFELFKKIYNSLSQTTDPLVYLLKSESLKDSLSLHELEACCSYSLVPKLSRLSFKKGSNIEYEASPLSSSSEDKQLYHLRQTFKVDALPTEIESLSLSIKDSKDQITCYRLLTLLWEIKLQRHFSKCPYIQSPIGALEIDPLEVFNLLFTAESTECSTQQDIENDFSTSQELKDNCNLDEKAFWEGKVAIDISYARNIQLLYAANNSISLKELIELGLSLSEEQIRTIAFQLLQACHHLHQEGFHHGHLNPVNIRVSFDDFKCPHIKIASFMLHNLQQSQDLFCSSYQAPELALQYKENQENSPFSKAIGPKADVYSIGHILEDLFIQTKPATKEKPLSKQQEHEILITPSTLENSLEAINPPSTACSDHRTIGHISSLLVKLIESVIESDLEKRASIDECLQHPYFHKNLSKAPFQDFAWPSPHSQSSSITRPLSMKKYHKALQNPLTFKSMSQFDWSRRVYNHNFEEGKDNVQNALTARYIRLLELLQIELQSLEEDFCKTLEAGAPLIRSMSLKSPLKSSKKRKSVDFTGENEIFYLPSEAEENDLQQATKKLKRTTTIQF